VFGSKQTALLAGGNRTAERCPALIVRAGLANYEGLVEGDSRPEHKVAKVKDSDVVSLRSATKLYGKKFDPGI